MFLFLFATIVKQMLSHKVINKESNTLVNHLKDLFLQPIIKKRKNKILENIFSKENKSY